MAQLGHFSPQVAYLLLEKGITRILRFLKLYAADKTAR